MCRILFEHYLGHQLAGQMAGMQSPRRRTAGARDVSQVGEALNAMGARLGGEGAQATATPKGKLLPWHVFAFGKTVEISSPTTNASKGNELDYLHRYGVFAQCHRIGTKS